MRRAIGKSLKNESSTFKEKVKLQLLKMDKKMTSTLKYIKIRNSNLKIATS